MLPSHLNVFTPLFWIQHCYELLWTLHCPKGRYCDVTMIRPLLFHGMRTDLRGSPGAAIVDCQSIYYLLDFKRTYFIFPWNNSTYDLDATVGWLESLGYSINARAFGPLTPYLAVGLAGVTMCTRVNNYLWNHIFCHFKASLFLFQLMFVLDKRNTLCLRDKVRQTSLGKSAVGVDLWSARPPLTSHWMSAGLYRVTTKCSYYNKSSIGVSYTSVQFEWDPFVNKDARSSWVTGTGPMRHKYQPRPMCFP